MATSKSTAAAAPAPAKAKTDEKAAEQSAATTTTTTEASATPDTDGTGDTEANSASAGVKQRRSPREDAAENRVPTQRFDYGDNPRELTDEQVEAQNGLPTFNLGGPNTSATNLAGSHVISAGKGSDYVLPEEDGFISFIVENSKTPTTIRVWSAGQAVKREVHEHYQGKASNKPETAKILDREDVLTNTY
jgi:hypothetical protein